jgi:hypothetical protein
MSTQHLPPGVTATKRRIIRRHTLWKFRKAAISIGDQNAGFVADILVKLHL